VELRKHRNEFIHQGKSCIVFPELPLNSPIGAASACTLRR